jgi:hypothetical protein
MGSRSASRPPAPEPFWHLVYRYWFWGWLFRDVNSGDLVRRAAAWQHNLRQRMHLPVYMRRWCASMAALALLAYGLETLVGAQCTAACFYVGAVLALCVQVFAGVAWLFLRPRATF